MARWVAVEEAEPQFAARVRQLFEAHKHKTLATLRRDGSPRISGIEAEFADGEIRLGMMGGSVKLKDLRNDPRLALHSATVDPPEDDPSSWPGEAKLAGRGVEVADPDHPGEPSGRFRLDVTEVVLTYVSEPPSHLIIESWVEGRGLRRWQR